MGTIEEEAVVESTESSSDETPAGERLLGQPSSSVRLSRKTVAIDVLIGALIGLAMACVIFDRSFFWGDDAAVIGISGDAGSSFAGFRAFISDSWHFPLLETDDLTSRGEPTIIAFTDSLPLLSLFAKVFGFLGISANNWIAIWYYGSVVAQGAAAGLLASSFRVQSRWTTAAISVMAVSAPVMMMRIWHPGLYGHFTMLLFWAAAGHFWYRRTFSSAWWLLGITVLSLLIHPYVFVMVGISACGVVLGSAVNGRLSVREAATWFATSGVVLVATMYLLGYLPNDAVPPGGYGAFGMSVVGPFWPQWSGLWPGDEWILLNENGAFEGINYLGAGTVFAVVVAMLVSWRRVWAFVIRQQILVAVLALLTAVAVTHHVSFWSQTPYFPLGRGFSAIADRDRTPLAVLALILLVCVAAFVWSWRSERGAVVRPALTFLAVVGVGGVIVTLLRPGFFLGYLEQFRASGRFFWIIGYGLSAGALVLIDRWFAERRDQWRAGPALLSVTMVLFAGTQIADTGRYRDQVPDMFLATPERVAQVEALIEIVSVHDEVRITPDWFCVVVVNEALFEFHHTVIASAVSGVKVDGLYGGRTATNTPCAERAVAPGGGVLTVAIRPLHFPELIDADPSVECLYTQHMALCSSRWDEVDPAIRDSLARIPLPWPPP